MTDTAPATQPQPDRDQSAAPPPKPPHKKPMSHVAGLIKRLKALVTGRS